jgi:hypothetical protein
VLAVASLVLAGVIRYFATRDASGKPQWPAIGIAIVSFALWVAALRPPAGPFDLDVNAFYAGLAALIWGAFIPVIYKGD